MVDVAQQVRASDCGSEGRGFEPRLPPKSPEVQGFLFSPTPLWKQQTHQYAKEGTHQTNNGSGKHYSRHY